MSGQSCHMYPPWRITVYNIGCFVAYSFTCTAFPLYKHTIFVNHWFLPPGRIWISCDMTKMRVNFWPHWFTCVQVQLPRTSAFTIFLFHVYYTLILSKKRTSAVSSRASVVSSRASVVCSRARQWSAVAVETVKLWHQSSSWQNDGHCIYA